MKHKRKHFGMIEIVLGLAVLMIMMSAISMTMNQLGRMERQGENDRQAILTLENTVERLEMRESIDMAQVKTSFMDEFSKSQLAKQKGVKASCARKKGKLVLTIKDPKRVLAYISIPLVKK